jgi:hypothetical protein
MDEIPEGTSRWCSCRIFSDVNTQTRRLLRQYFDQNNQGRIARELKGTKGFRESFSQQDQKKSNAEIWIYRREMCGIRNVHACIGDLQEKIEGMLALKQTKSRLNNSGTAWTTNWTIRYGEKYSRCCSKVTQVSISLPIPPYFCRLIIVGLCFQRLPAEAYLTRKTFL